MFTGVSKGESPKPFLVMSVYAYFGREAGRRTKGGHHG